MNPDVAAPAFALTYRCNLRLSSKRWFGVPFFYWSRVAVWSLA